MPGPPPKDPKTRQRRNKPRAGAARLEAAPIARKPVLPDRTDGVEWHPLAREWWTTVWASPMAAQYVDGDIPDLLMLAELRHRFWLDPSVPLAAELRHHGQRFGLSPLDRRRLEWEIAKVEAVQDGPKRRRPPRPADDPRRLLTAVK